MLLFSVKRFPHHARVVYNQTKILHGSSISLHGTWKVLFPVYIIIMYACNISSFDRLAAISSQSPRCTGTVRTIYLNIYAYTNWNKTQNASVHCCSHAEKSIRSTTMRYDYIRYTVYRLHNIIHSWCLRIPRHVFLRQAADCVYVMTTSKYNIDLYYFLQLHAHITRTRVYTLGCVSVQRVVERRDETVL